MLLIRPNTLPAREGWERILAVNTHWMGCYTAVGAHTKTLLLANRPDPPWTTEMLADALYPHEERIGVHSAVLVRRLYRALGAISGPRSTTMDGFVTCTPTVIMGQTARRRTWHANTVAPPPAPQENAVVELSLAARVLALEERLAALEDANLFTALPAQSAAEVKKIAGL